MPAEGTMVDITIRNGAGMATEPDGTSYPVTHWFDEFGENCEWDEATACVYGAGDYWVSMRLEPEISHLN